MAIINMRMSAADFRNKLSDAAKGNAAFTLREILAAVLCTMMQDDKAADDLDDASLFYEIAKYEGDNPNSIYLAGFMSLRVKDLQGLPDTSDRIPTFTRMLEKHMRDDNPGQRFKLEDLRKVLKIGDSSQDSTDLREALKIICKGNARYAKFDKNGDRMVQGRWTFIAFEPYTG